MKNKEAALIPQKTDEESRREFLVKAGKMALYIPPTMMVLMHPSRNAFACSKSVSIRPNCGPGGHGHGGCN
jgi:formiminotetrahydrofolate cyclodeaminase